MKRALAVVLLFVCGLLPAFAQTHSTIVTYNGLTEYGQRNRDSLIAALRRLGVDYDSIDRNVLGSNSFDYSRWCTVLWASGDPSGLEGQSFLRVNEMQDLQHFLQSGATEAKKSLVIAGQNIAYWHGDVMPN